MKKSIKIISSFSLVFLIGCVSIKDSKDEKTNWKPEFNVQAGLNKGGITENTELTDVDEASVDAFSGATNTGFNVGAHAKAPLVFNFLEAGIDYMYNKQFFTYQDDINNFRGEREIGVSQFMLPLTYNMTFMKSRFDGGLFQLKLGMMFQFNLLNASDAGINIPDYSYNKFSNGVLMGFEATPIHLSTGARLGFYADFYRGSQLYKDFYNQSSFESPGTSFFKAGLIYHFNTK